MTEPSRKNADLLWKMAGTKLLFQWLLWFPVCGIRFRVFGDTGQNGTLWLCLRRFPQSGTKKSKGGEKLMGVVWMVILFCEVAVWNTKLAVVAGGNFQISFVI
ncbi:hypothetical protein AVEN_221158-1 [Araneus ventricosus]|uniref:Uncharacterized protein n=1 Tax=Araneus ventricosus TaxID=182803 RepID=A0A4Y2MXP8_ARAVE|nr:hypothetical protein AVEN_221158-1 [Araneus ventricosus]